MCSRYLFNIIMQNSLAQLEPASKIVILFHCPKGVSFLEVKNHVLLAYMADLVLLMLKKVSGKSIQGHPAILRLVENRTVSFIINSLFFLQDFNTFLIKSILTWTGCFSNI